MMNVEMGFNPAAVSRTSLGPTQAQINSQAAMTGAAAAASAQDTLVKDKARERAMQAVGTMTSRRKVTDKTGVTKVASAKKR